MLAAGDGASAGAHPDAETAAAWMERRLDAAALQAVDAHLADCADCQAMVAVLARISDDTLAPAAPAWWQRLRGGWLIPATVAAAAGLVIWIAVPQQRSTSSSAALSSAPESSTRPAAIPPSASRRGANTPAAAAVPGAAAAPTNSAERDALAHPAPEGAVPLRKAASQPPAAPKLEAERPLVDEARRQRDNRETATVTRETPAVPSPAAGAAAASGERRDNAASAPSTAQFAADRAEIDRAATLLVIARDTGAQWRRAGTTFEFAPRADAPFTTATLPIAADVIVAGASPGGTVCWLVGRGGTVLLTTDGIRFVRVAPPAAIDLTGVAAIDARTATVAAGSGRRFRTTDGGTTWTPAP